MRHGAYTASALTAAALAIAGCGESTTAVTKAKSSRFVDLKAQPPFINTLDVDPRDGSFLLTTNRGFWRIDANGEKADPVRGEVSVRGASSPVGTFLEVRTVGPGELLGSGHPDAKDTKLPEFLGLLRSNDGGLNWSVVSRPGIADMHVMRLAHDRLYAFDAVLGLMLVSTDGGRSWEEHAAPRGELMVDFVVDPGDPDHIIGSTEENLYVSQDEGKSWRPLEPGTRSRLGWPTAGVLYRADVDGSFRKSADRGRTWQEVGDIGGEPGDMAVVDEQKVHVALIDGTIRSSADGGRTWETTFTP